ncbi:tellurite resistance protein TehB [Novipirellula aureliae]|uniref:Tellurite resistance protein TehB n=1 Tax=Novipirellula aureliae TaxID=2527966 RepID=A0A5C6DZW4_9BACT|nr:class I SAM-dependent methyltransferase [Novipirellula aureliae]TWU41317.1 tellurite resistance protein TehB [Novipirellula aureliae]
MSDPFFEPYDRDDIAYGEKPSGSLAAYLNQVKGGGKALDLGAGAGRDSIALAIAGYQVLAVDLSARGLERIAQRAERAGVLKRVETLASDVRKIDLPPNTYDAIVATTVLDHIPLADSQALWKRMTEALTDRGVLYVQVHTTEDPGSDQLPGRLSDAPVSETAAEVINYFSPNQLASWAADPDRRLRILRYEERLEWDYTHGPEHLHGKAVLLAVRSGLFPNWYGQPAAFPKQE